MKNYLFVYGTLMSTEHNSNILAHCKLVGKGEAYGFALVDLGGCPGMVLGKTSFRIPSVIGEVYEIPEEEFIETIILLDRIEHNGTLYKRVKIPVNLAGKTVECIAYLYMMVLKPGNLIPSGNFRGKK